MIQSILDFYTENIAYVAFLFFVILVIILLRMIQFIKKVLRYFGDKQFEVKSYYHHDLNSQTSSLMLRIYNKNIHDLRLSSFGYQYMNETIDITNLYKHQFQMSDTQTITVQPRDYLELSFNPTSVRDKIMLLNQKSYRVKPIKAYVIDALGMTSMSKVPLVRAYVQKELHHIKKERKEEKYRLSQLKRTQSIEALHVLKKTTQKKVSILLIDIRIWFKKTFSRKNP